MKQRRAPRGSSSEEPRPASPVAERVEQVLRTRGLTLSEVARETTQRYNRTPRYRVPHNFYYDLKLPGYSPKIEQLLALSRVANYRLADWLTLFGFDLSAIAELQLKFPGSRTALLDSTMVDPAAWMDWFEDTSVEDPVSRVLPLGQLLVASAPRRAAALATPVPSPFLYAKIGREDALAFPDLLPGSVVRADTRVGRTAPAASLRLFLVEHAQGIVACRLQATTGGRVILRSETLPFLQPELRLNAEVRILGALDWELRLVGGDEPELRNSFGESAKPKTLLPVHTRATVQQVLERARSRRGFSLRAASAKTHWVAETLGDPRYFCAAASLAEYERKSQLPAHIHKILSLSILYSLGFWDLLRSAGLDLDDAGQETIPDAFVGRIPPELARARNPAEPAARKGGFLNFLLREFEEIPLFLGPSLSALVGLPGLSLRDLFWTGGGATFHTSLKDAIFVAVNRRAKKPRILRQKPLSEQPVYVLLLRDGTYRLANCSVEGSTLAVPSLSSDSAGPQRLRNGVDAEVVGQVTALFRRLQ